MSFYYLNDSNQPVGPMDLPAIQKLVQAGVVTRDVLVCEAGSEKWESFSEKDESKPEPQAPKPPRTAPPPRSALPPRSYTPPAHTSEARPQATVSSNSATHPDWFPLASMIAGITAILAMCLPVLSIILAAPALTLGILAIRQNITDRKPFAVAGIATASVAIVASLGILLLGIGAGFGGNPEAAAIEKVLKQDQALYREATSKFPTSASQATRHIADRIQRIDTTRCPPEFRLAFQQHVNAWKQSVPYVQADTPLTAFFEGLYAGATEDYSVLGLSNYQARLAKEQVSATYREVLNVAAMHGARIPD